MVGTLQSLTVATLAAATQSVKSSSPSSGTSSESSSSSGRSSKAGESIEKKVDRLQYFHFAGAIEGIVNKFYEGDQVAFERFVGYSTTWERNEEGEVTKYPPAGEMLELFKRAFKQVLGQERFNEEFNPAHPDMRSEYVKQSDLTTLYEENMFFCYYEAILSLRGGRYIWMNHILLNSSLEEIKKAFNKLISKLYSAY